ncbi:hypothetical protein AB0K49_13070 [Streptomyces decoyicus]|uniref:hypothetical protein n=1 Tax=Streptomyces decoyicus TaxID=249567 RepID=UPI00345DA053
MSGRTARTGIKVVGVLMGAMSLAMVSTAAYAGSNTWALTTDDNPGGRAGFDHDGPGAEQEFIRICDQDDDGYRATVQASWSGGSLRLDALGNGKCVHTRPSFNIAEGKTVTIKVCLRKGYSGSPKFCASARGVA